jgi:putative DNA primase/helicase
MIVMRLPGSIATTKFYCPWSYRESKEGAGDWAWRPGNPDGPRPLYHLDELARRSDAPVLVCEGEKATDAAARLFPEFVATTSPGGSQAADKADWSPLKGRTIWIWPDRDEAGRGYAKDVSRLLLTVGSTSVAIVDVWGGVSDEALSRFPEKPRNKWDLADGIPEGIDSRKLLSEAKEVPAERNPRDTRG